MRQWLLIAAAVLLFSTTTDAVRAAERQTTFRALQEKGPVSQVRQVAAGQFSDQPIQVHGPVSRVLELNRRKNDFIIRTVFGR